MRMLPVVQRLIVPGFARLKKQWITAAAFGQRIETHHQAYAQLGGVAEQDARTFPSANSARQCGRRRGGC